MTTSVKASDPTELDDLRGDIRMLSRFFDLDLPPLGAPLPTGFAAPLLASALARLVRAVQARLFERDHALSLLGARVIIGFARHWRRAEAWLAKALPRDYPRPPSRYLELGRSPQLPSPLQGFGMLRDLMITLLHYLAPLNEDVSRVVAVHATPVIVDMLRRSRHAARQDTVHDLLCCVPEGPFRTAFYETLATHGAVAALVDCDSVEEAQQHGDPSLSVARTALQLLRSYKGVGVWEHFCDTHLISLLVLARRSFEDADVPADRLTVALDLVTVIFYESSEPIQYFVSERFYSVFIAGSRVVQSVLAGILSAVEEIGRQSPEPPNLMYRMWCRGFVLKLLYGVAEQTQLPTYDADKLGAELAAMLNARSRSSGTSVQSFLFERADEIHVKANEFKQLGRLRSGFASLLAKLPSGSAGGEALGSFLADRRWCRTVCANDGCAQAWTEKLKTCARCKTVSYCSVHCQKVHWRNHKAQCKVAMKQ